MTLAGAKLGELIVCETLARTVGSCNVLPTISLPFPYHSTHLLCGLDLDSWLTGYTEMCIQESEVGGAEVDGFKSYAPFSLPRAHSIPLALRVRTSSLRRRVPQLK